VYSRMRDGDSATALEQLRHDSRCEPISVTAESFGLLIGAELGSARSASNQRMSPTQIIRYWPVTRARRTSAIGTYRSAEPA